MRKNPLKEKKIAIFLEIVQSVILSYRLQKGGVLVMSRSYQNLTAVFCLQELVNRYSIVRGKFMNTVCY